MTAPSIPALLEPIQERLDAATPGPWHPHDIAEVDQPRNHIHPDRPWWWVWQTSKLPNYGGVLKIEDYGEGKDGAIGEVTSGGDRDIPQQWADAVFIAAARTDTARLLAAVKAVVELHRVKFYNKWGREEPEDQGKGGWCSTCGRFDGTGCPTVSAVEAALREEA